MSVDSLYSNLKAIMRPLDTKHKKSTFKDNKIKLFNDYPVTLTDSPNLSRIILSSCMVNKIMFISLQVLV